MIDNLKSMFNLKESKLNDLDILQNSSANAVNIFNETIKKLSSINDNVSSSIRSRELEIASLKSETIKLTELQDSNNKVIDKLNSILQ